MTGEPLEGPAPGAEAARHRPWRCRPPTYPARVLEPGLSPVNRLATSRK